MNLTILTPTYNREKELSNLWNSLKNQTNHEFEWVIIDDGSTDHTRELVQGYSENSEFPVRYYHKENGGKHRAVNYVMQFIESELTFIVDSDDILAVDAVENVLEVHSRYGNRDDLCGYAFLRAFPDGTVNGKAFLEDELIASFIDVRINGKDTDADKAEVFFTKCLKEFPFPEYEGERFIGEGISWIRMARKYKMVHFNRKIYIGNYLEGGLTNNQRRNSILSPRGCMDRAAELMKPDIRWPVRTKAGMQYVVYGRFAGYSSGQLIKDSDFPYIVCLCTIPGLLIYRKWKKEYL